MKTYRHPPCACPYCGEAHDALSDLSGQKQAPKAGDMGMCSECGEWQVVTKDGGFRKPTTEEFMEIADDPQARIYRAIWVAYDRDRKAKKANT